MARPNVIRLARAALSAHLPRGSSSVRHTLLYTRFSCYKCAVRGDELRRRLFVLQVNESLCSGGCREYNTAACNQTRPLFHSYSSNGTWNLSLLEFLLLFLNCFEDAA
nr:chaperone protein DnaJ GFA2, mitochondrial-like isoform X1 [Ipomoea batatas]